MLILGMVSLIIAVNFRTFLDTFFSAKKRAKMRQKKAHVEIVKYGQNLKGRWVN